MNLVLVTSNFPYGSYDEFLIEEICELSKTFEKILILSFSKDKENQRILPLNVQYSNCRYCKNKLIQYFCVIIKMFSPTTIREAIFAYKKLKIKDIISIIKLIFIYQRHSIFLEQTLCEFPDFIHNSLYYSFWLGSHAYSVFRVWKKGYCKAIISRTHGFDAFIERGYIPFRREILSSFDEIHSISQAGIDSITQNLLPFIHCKKDNLILSRLGVVKTSDKLNPPMCDSSRLCIISCSSVIKLKRLDLIIDALSTIDNINIMWTHFGSGNIFDEIVNYAKKRLGSMKNILYTFKGQISNDDIKKFYEDEHIDIFINASDYEGVPVSIMEAFSYGIPAIARDVGGINEIIENKVNGILLPKDCSKLEINEAIYSYYKMNTENKNIYAQNAYKTFNEKYNAKKNYEIFCKHLISKYNTTTPTS